MKTFLVSLAALVAFVLPATAQATVGRTNIPPQVTLAWTPSVDPTVSGYNLYQGGSSGVYTNVLTIANAATAQVTVLNVLRGGTYFWAITSTATNGLESVYSNEVTWTVPNLPTPPVMKPPTGR